MEWIKMSEKIIAVVGAGPGVGLAVAKRFAREGYRPILMARRQETLTAGAVEIGENAVTMVADAANPTSLRDAFSEIAGRYGSPDVLVYNVAVLQQSQPSKLEVDTLLEEFHANVVGALVSAQQVIPKMREQKSGTILFTGGGLALNPYPTYASLAIGKAGLRSLALTLAAELAPDGIHVATVTITGFVKPGTFFDPDKIADTYWDLHTQSSDQWQKEVVYQRG